LLYEGKKYPKSSISILLECGDGGRGGHLYSRRKEKEVKDYLLSRKRKEEEMENSFSLLKRTYYFPRKEKGRELAATRRKKRG